jgi:hypothetical protein
VTRTSYSDKLKDPRWQKKRLEILQRDDWTCQRCGEKNNTLVVHHRIYLPDHEPWDCPNRTLITLCETCHNLETEAWPDVADTLVSTIKRRLWADQAVDLGISFLLMKPECPDKQELESMLSWFGILLSHPNLRTKFLGMCSQGIFTQEEKVSNAQPEG